MSDFPDLSAYANERKLAWAPSLRATPFDCIFGLEEAENHNTMVGLLPGGMFGVMGHRVLRSGPISETATVAAVVVPETKTTLVAVDARAAQVQVDTPYGLALGDPQTSTDNWYVCMHERTNTDLWSQLWDGQLGQWLRPSLGWSTAADGSAAPGGRLVIRAGIVSLWAAGVLSDPAGLDNLAQGAISAAGFARSVCKPATETAKFDTPLIKPQAWVTQSQAQPQRLSDALVQGGNAINLLDAGATEEGAYAGLRDFARAYAQPRGLRIEDGASFDKAFPSLPFTGWTQVAFSGRLPDGRAIRLAISAQRPYVDYPSVASGAIVAVSPVSDGTPDHGLSHDPSVGAFTAISDGLRVIWRPHEGMTADQAGLDAVVAKIIG